MLNNFISLRYLSKVKIDGLLVLTREIKSFPHKYENKLKNKTVALLFQKPSLRTKTSFCLATSQLGGNYIYFSPEEVNLGKRESIVDVARTLSRYVNCVVLRTFSHKVITKFVSASTIPVINGLSDLLHPCQVLGDLFTLYELGRDVRKIKFVYIGDGNNVCHSFIYAFSIIGGNLTVITPKKYEPNQRILKEARDFAKVSGAKLEILNNPQEGIKNADVVYTDVWVSMGKEEEEAERMKAFEKFQVNREIMQLAKKDCLVMHCLPAHRGQEITSDVLDSKNSIVFLQVENRLHTAKAILISLLGGEG